MMGDALQDPRQVFFSVIPDASGVASQVAERYAEGDRASIWRFPPQTSQDHWGASLARLLMVLPNRGSGSVRSGCCTWPL